MPELIRSPDLFDGSNVSWSIYEGKEYHLPENVAILYDDTRGSDTYIVHPYSRTYGILSGFREEAHSNIKQNPAFQRAEGVIFNGLLAGTLSTDDIGARMHMLEKLFMKLRDERIGSVAGTLISVVSDEDKLYLACASTGVTGAVVIRSGEIIYESELQGISPEWSLSNYSSPTNDHDILDMIEIQSGDNVLIFSPGVTNLTHETRQQEIEESFKQSSTYDVLMSLGHMNKSAQDKTAMLVTI